MLKNITQNPSLVGAVYGAQSLEGSDETLWLPESRRVRRDVVVPRVSKGLTSAMENLGDLPLCWKRFAECQELLRLRARIWHETAPTAEVLIYAQ